ncbi:MAG: type I methionyl aminopeptidase [Ignavibacteria bacterium]|nr:type I methionyl aminopeptidase [Ignavibacteria bacterium]
MGLIKTKKEIDLIRESCKIVSEVLKHIKQYIKPGVKTKELNSEIEDFIVSRNAVPAFKGYGGNKKVKPFPAAACISINDEVVHGIPGDKELAEGDIVSVDVGVLKNGYFGDSAYTFSVGKISDKKNKLLRITEEALYLGIAEARAGNVMNDLSYAIQELCESNGFGVVRVLVGHGIGKKLHEEPAVPNFYSRGNNFEFREGMTIAIEPMINYGTHEVMTLNDGWTIVTRDGEPSAHFEHTILITNGEAEILT